VRAAPQAHSDRRPSAARSARESITRGRTRDDGRAGEVAADAFAK